MIAELRPQNESGLAAANNQPAKTYRQSTNDLDFPTGQRQRKDEAQLRAHLKRGGHSVTRGYNGDFTVIYNGHYCYCEGLAELEAYANHVGVRHGL